MHLKSSTNWKSHKRHAIMYWCVKEGNESYKGYGHIIFSFFLYNLVLQIIIVHLLNCHSAWYIPCVQWMNERGEYEDEYWCGDRQVCRWRVGSEGKRVQWVSEHNSKELRVTDSDRELTMAL